MTMTLDPVRSRKRVVTPAEHLRREFAAARVSFMWLGVHRSLSRQQKELAAQPFDAQGTSLSATKKLLDTRHSAYLPVTRIRNAATAYWRGISLPYPEPGIRLIRQDRIEAFNDHLQELKTRLDEAVGELDAHYEDLKAAAQQRLGRLFDPGDYPRTLTGLFDVMWDFPSVEPPDYLLQLRPELYAQEQARVAARFQEAVKLTEEAFIGEFSRLLDHLLERLQDGPEGPKVFRDSAVGNLVAFFERFGQLNIRSSQQLDALIDHARQIVQGTAPQALRDSGDLRSGIAHKLSGVQQDLEALLVDKPRRRILRAGKEAS
jgi:hypothetical protein